MRTRLVLLALVAVQIAWYWPRLPHVIASHFDVTGRANGWMSREAFVGVYVAVVALLTVVFSAVRIVPPSLWNLPNKAYWLAPERRAATVARVADEMTSFANATLALVLATFELAFRANLPGGTFAADVMWVVLGAYLIFVVARLVRFVRSWSR
jgi:uncharacterized membrane protein